MAATYHTFRDRIFRTLSILNIVIIATSIGLAGCSDLGTTADETEQPIPIISESNVDKLAQQVANLKNALSIRDYDQAKALLSQFRDTWAQMKDTVKAQTPAKEEAIEIHIQSIENGLNASTPNNSALASDLKLLEVVVYQLLEQPE